MSAGSFMELAHRYHIQNMEQKAEINSMTYLGTSVSHMGRNHVTVSMTMSMKDLERLALNDHMFHEMVAQDAQEESIRDACPAAQAAYNHYKMLLNLAK
jgi:hypothetical protein